MHNTPGPPDGRRYHLAWMPQSLRQFIAMARRLHGGRHGPSAHKLLS